MKLIEAGADITTMTQYRADLEVPIAFPEQEVHETLAEVLAEHGVRQLHAGETEKYAHVTYFFNGGREAEWAGETRILVPSPRDVPSYDHKPEMSARELTDRFVDELDRDDYGFAVINLANPDMVGHTGSIPATVKAVETADECLGESSRRSAARAVSPDHRRPRQRRADARGRWCKPTYRAHDEPRPVDRHRPRSDPRRHRQLADLVPTVLGFLGFTQPLQMTGKPLTIPA